MLHCSFQHQTSPSPRDTSTTECHFCFGPAAPFFLELFVIALCSSPVAYRTPSDQRDHLPVSFIFAFSYCLWGSSGKNTGVGCHSLLQRTMFCQNSMTCLSLVALHLVTHICIELRRPLHHDKAVIYEGAYLCVCLIFSRRLEAAKEWELVFITLLFFLHYCSCNRFLVNLSWLTQMHTFVFPWESQCLQLVKWIQIFEALIFEWRCMDAGASPVAQMVNSLPAMWNAGDLSSIPGSRRSPEEDKGYPFHKYRCMIGPRT